MMRAIACAALLAGCAPRPLRTPELTPTNACPQATGTPVALAGFEREHGAILRVPLAQLLEAHGYRIVATPADAAIVVSLDDLFAHVTSAATARRRANIYFTATLLAAWMMPIMSGSGAYDSTVEIEAWLSVRSTRSGRSPVRDVKRATATERPSGFPGETDLQFAARVLDRIGANLAVAFFDERCGALVP